MSTTTTTTAPTPASRVVVLASPLKRLREPDDEAAHGRSRPAPVAVLYSAQGPDLSVQNSDLFYAHEVAAAAQLDQRIAPQEAHPMVQRQMRDLLDALALEDDQSFYEELCVKGYSVALRYAWLWCRFASCDEDEVNLIFPTGRGFVHELVDGHLHGRASSKQAIVDALLQHGPLPYAHRARNVLKAVQAQGPKRHAAPAVPPRRR